MNVKAFPMNVVLKALVIIEVESPCNMVKAWQIEIYILYGYEEYLIHQ